MKLLHLRQMLLNLLILLHGLLWLIMLIFLYRDVDCLNIYCHFLHDLLLDPIDLANLLLFIGEVYFNVY